MARAGSGVGMGRNMSSRLPRQATLDRGHIRSSASMPVPMKRMSSMPATAAYEEYSELLLRLHPHL